MNNDRFTDDCSPNDAVTEAQIERDELGMTHLQAIEALEDKLAEMEDERDAAILERDGLGRQFEAASDAVETFLAEGRPHARHTTAYPDGCECPLCEQWDALNRAWQAVGEPIKNGQSELLRKERDAAIIERDKIQGLFALLTDQNIWLSRKLGAIRDALDGRQVPLSEVADELK